jgi:hypothetical protein
MRWPKTVDTFQFWLKRTKRISPLRADLWGTVSIWRAALSNIYSGFFDGEKKLCTNATVHSYTMRILVRRSGLAERYNAAHCWLPLHLASGTGFHWCPVLRCTNPRRPIAMPTNFRTVSPNIRSCRCTVWDLLHVTLSAHTILRWLLDFWKIYVPLVQCIFSVKFCDFQDTQKGANAPELSWTLLLRAGFLTCMFNNSQSQWPSALRQGSAADRIADSKPAGSMAVRTLWVLCVLSGRGLCDGPIPRPEESYRLRCIYVTGEEKP